MLLSKILIINNKYYSKSIVSQLEYGFHDDAIFKGSGLPDLVDEKNSERKDWINVLKYQKCIKNILEL